MHTSPHSSSSSALTERSPLLFPHSHLFLSPTVQVHMFPANRPSDGGIGRAGAALLGWLRSRRVRLALCVFFNLLAAIFLIPGLSLPLLTVVVKVGQVELLRQTRSTIGTIRFLHSEGADLPAALIALFSVFVPVFKFFVLLVIALCPSMKWRRLFYLFVRNWSKWSMADVFVTAVFVAFLSANAAPATMAAQVEPGFYYFLAYCMLSLTALQLMPKPKLEAWQEAEIHGAELAEPDLESRSERPERSVARPQQTSPESQNKINLPSPPSRNVNEEKSRFKQEEQADESTAHELELPESSSLPATDNKTETPNYSMLKIQVDEPSLEL